MDENKLLFGIDGILCHHGIQGQKWGVRRYQNPDGTLTPAGRKRYSKKGIIINKGTKFYRISSDKEDAENRDYKYVTSLQKDRDYYKGVYSQDMLYDPKKYTPDQFSKLKLKDIIDESRKEGRVLYELTYTANKDLISPSKNERVKAFQKLIQNDPDSIEKVRALLLSDKWYAKDDEKKKEINEVLDTTKYKRYEDIVKNERGLQLFSASLNDQNEIRKKYFEILKDSGYNVIIDDNDAGVLSLKPMILINPSDVVQKVQAKELMAKDIVDAYNSWISDYNKTQDNKIDLLDESEWK